MTKPMGVVFQYGNELYLASPWVQEFLSGLKTHNPRLSAYFDKDLKVWCFDKSDQNMFLKLARKYYQIIDLTWSDEFISSKETTSSSSRYASFISELSEEEVYKLLVRHYINTNNRELLNKLNEAKYNSP